MRPFSNAGPRLRHAIGKIAWRAMKHASLNQLLLRVLLVVYVVRLFPVTHYLLRGQVALKSVLAAHRPAAPVAPRAIGARRSAAAAALDAAAATSADLAAAAQPAALVEIVASDENGPVLITVTPEHAAIISVRPPLLWRRTAFNVSSARWQLEDVALAPDGEEEDGSDAGEQHATTPVEPAAALAAGASAGSGGAIADGGARASLEPASAATTAAGPEAQFLDAVLRFRNARTRKSHLVLCSNADAARLRGLHRRAVVRRQLAQIDKDVRRSALSAGGLRARVLREVLVAHALQHPLSDRYCQGNNLVCTALVRALLCGVPARSAGARGGAAGADADAEAEAEADEADEACAAAFPHLGASNLLALRAEFVDLGLFPAPPPTARALARLRSERDGGARATAWAATHVLLAFRYLMETQGLGALSPSEGGRADEAKAAAVRTTLDEHVRRVEGPLASILAEASEAAAVAEPGRADGGERHGANDEAVAAAGAGFARAQAAAEAAALAAEAAVASPAALPTAADGAERASGGADGDGAPDADGARSNSPSPPPAAARSAAKPLPPNFDLLGAMLSAFDPMSALCTLGVAPSRALLGGGAAADGAAAGAADEPSAAEQAHILATWRVVLRAASPAEAQSALLKALGARLLGYCHEIRGFRWTDQWQTSMLDAAQVFAEDWSATLRAHLTTSDAHGTRRDEATRPAAVPADKLEWLATTFKSGWRAPELERALLRTRLPTKLRAPPARASS
ncbi:hypothetical protein KFE25_010713 [Diacronema lutheri]|uniref:Uncharacterized protein n=1 Tax=Diacronema lutheri TaxID=2081491 RepID=A0A8J5XCA9_DIALT|nr:hypothetical protein KFE25_010713 [Diacronema lutheri]